MSYSSVGTNYIPTDPQRLAGGLTVDAAFVPFQLWAGEAPIITGQGIAGANMPKYAVVARDTLNGNTLVLWNPNAADGAPVADASGTYTFSAAPAAADTVTIAGNVLTWAVPPVGSIGQIPEAPESGETPIFTVGTLPIGAVVAEQDDVNGNILTPARTAAQSSALNLMNYVNTYQATLGVHAELDATSLIVTIYANSAGTAGNAITIAKSSSAIAVSGSTLAGGTVDANRQLSTGKAIGFLAAPAISGQFVPLYLGGAPNHEVLIWPAGIDTIGQRKAAFDQTAIFPSVLRG